MALYDWLLCKQMPEKLLSVRSVYNQDLLLYFKLAFTRPKTSLKVGPLNWTQEHKSV